MVSMRPRFFLSTLLLVLAMILTGCPGLGDRLRVDEEAKVSTEGNKVCFGVPDADGLYLEYIAINPRGTKFKQQNVYFDPNISITAGYLCLPPTFYRFPNKGQFIVEYVLTNKQQANPPRKIVAGLEISNSHIYSIPLTDTETSKPYSSINKP
ncbi:putative T6SS immunity periplasmic lipoprotein [Serratia aquatilis]|uniref:T6SS immunity periplasmic lipoprotein n=1 Tax=Serratia aquatilis TaxID=1737515 RepID=A0ABV6EJG9_9GAMM